MSKFQVGDKVSVYENGQRYVGHIARVQERILHVERVDAAVELQVHPKQCRKIKKRMQLWVSQQALFAIMDGHYSDVKPKLPEVGCGEWFKFREVKK
jgi:hypothetical protein